jgi:hypothetical protein
MDGIAASAQNDSGSAHVRLVKGAELRLDGLDAGRYLRLHQSIAPGSEAEGFWSVASELARCGDAILEPIAQAVAAKVQPELDIASAIGAQASSLTCHGHSVWKGALLDPQVLGQLSKGWDGRPADFDNGELALDTISWSRRLFSHVAVSSKSLTAATTISLSSKSAFSALRGRLGGNGPESERTH